MVDNNSRGNDGGGNAARFIGMGFILGLILGVVVLVGFFVDKLAGTLPLCFLVGLSLCLVGILYYVFVSLLIL